MKTPKKKTMPLRTIIVGKVKHYVPLGNTYFLTIESELEEISIYVERKRELKIGDKVVINKPRVVLTQGIFLESELGTGDIYGYLEDTYEFENTKELPKVLEGNHYLIKGLALGRHKLFDEVVQYGEECLFYPHYITDTKLIGVYVQLDGMAKVDVEFDKSCATELTNEQTRDYMRNKGVSETEISMWMGIED